uniref:Uncharacterized protein n=1 Tax=Candidatus Kentrum sp. MB TaxID=2138164 RepID=A0A451BE51_9GAMM|nr:MAG: hypothetical protein BECKMB1821G_GA0114241_105517 [Candidatus Kentron sp. MB]VFK33918.1 MAG: hypothetical protein BECKMB1821I_GA0114274_105617 [Candidatus Kentron sp. MB]VFK76515.1 MAG: hypothetical protein BECKMB1821H_GA0114242_106017 [Candidatus Kentron sp. MB]
MELKSPYIMPLESFLSQKLPTNFLRRPFFNL